MATPKQPPISKDKLVSMWVENMKVLRTPGKGPKSISPGNYVNSLFTTALQQGGMEDEVKAWCAELQEFYMTGLEVMKMKLLNAAYNAPNQVLVTNGLGSGAEAVPFGALLSNVRATFDRMSKEPLQTYAYILTYCRVDFGFCAVCQRTATFHVGQPSQPHQPWKPCWFPQANVSNVSQWLSDIDYPQSFLPIVALCGVGSPACRTNCVQCGSFPDASFLIEEIKSWKHDALCRSCCSTGLLAVVPPKLNRQGLRDYAHKFSRLKK